MNLKSSLNAQQIKDEALRLGFDACGIATAGAVSDAPLLSDWLRDGCAAEMSYMHNHFEKRVDPRDLVEGCRSVIVVALNYFPQTPKELLPHFSYYAYGLDYHEVIKDKLNKLYEFINKEIAPIQGRMFTDSAPVLERYWAQQAGIGFIGKNTQLILPSKGSYFFIGELLIDLELPADTPINNRCGSCTRCLDACPTHALVRAGRLDARRCISYQTIENKGAISDEVAQVMNDTVYGCDICQQVCPWNRFAIANTTAQFQPSLEFMQLDYERMSEMTQADFSRIFKGSAIKRVGFKGLKRNVEVLLGKDSTTK